jgi:hypothetical protein
MPLEAATIRSQTSLENLHNSVGGFQEHHDALHPYG